MESRSVPREESKQQVAIFPEGKEADVQTQELLSRYRLSFLCVKPAQRLQKA